MIPWMLSGGALHSGSPFWPIGPLLLHDNEDCDPAQSLLQNRMQFCLLPYRSFLHGKHNLLRKEPSYNCALRAGIPQRSSNRYRGLYLHGNLRRFQTECHDRLCLVGCRISDIFFWHIIAGAIRPVLIKLRVLTVWAIIMRG